MIDWADITVTIGVIFIFISLYLSLGIVAGLAFVGTILIIVGIVAAWKRAQKPAR